MTFLSWSWHPLALILLASFVWLYVRGWQRLRTVLPMLANKKRLFLLLLSVCLLLAVTVSPLYTLSEYYLFTRALQKVFVCMLAAPLLLLACPFHVVAWGLPTVVRRAVTRQLIRRSPLRNILKIVTQSGITWLLFLSTFLIWHEPSFANWSIQQEWTRRFSIWVLFYAALIFWWHVTHTGPRIHKELPGWIMIVYLIGVEIPNMFTGVSIAFSDAPIYDYYRNVQSQLPAVNQQLLHISTLEDQMIGGGLTWVMGSAVYVTSIVMVLNKLFKQENNQPPMLSLNTEPTERTIAPGLEHRVQKHRWQQAGYDGSKTERFIVDSKDRTP